MINLFNWLRNKKKNELIKCVYQNRRATNYLGSYLIALGSSDAVDIVNAMKYRLTEIFERSDYLENISDDDFRDLLDMNMALRNIYSALPYSKHKDFDTHFTPSLGWKEYYTAIKRGDADG